MAVILDSSPSPAPAPPGGHDPRDPRDPRDPTVRLDELFDRQPGWEPVGSAPAVRSARGRIAGVDAVAFATDPRVRGGALGVAECSRIAEVTDLAVAAGIPVVGLWHSGGALLTEGVEALDAVGRIFAAMVRASGTVPQISVVLGPAAGGAAYGPALTDVVVMGPAARVFVTGPDVVRSVTGEDVDTLRLGGPETHGRRSGVAHVVADTDAQAVGYGRRLVGLLGAPGRPDLDALTPGSPAAALPANPRRAYDIRPLVAELLDPPTTLDPAPSVELHAGWAPNAVTVLGRMAGATVGVLANNPLRLAGCLDATSAEKAARFVRMCDAFGIPIVTVVDVPGYLPGVDQEWTGVVRRGAKLLHAFAEASVPRVTLLVRKAYGGAYVAMNSRSLGATAVLAWPDAECAVMGASAAVGILHRRALAAVSDEDRPALLDRLVAEQQATAGGVRRALELGIVDAVVDPSDTRRAIAGAIAAAVPARGSHTNIPL